MKKLLLILTTILLFTACKHDITINIRDAEGQPVSEATVFVTEQDIPGIHRYVTAFEAELEQEVFTETGIEIGLDSTVAIQKAETWFATIGRTYAESELDALYEEFLKTKESTKWIVNNATTDAGGAIQAKLKGGRHNILIEKDGFVKSYTFHTFNKGDRKNFTIKLGQ